MLRRWVPPVKGLKFECIQCGQRFVLQGWRRSVNMYCGMRCFYKARANERCRGYNGG